ncbi:BTAD domain-containing putative transcriptional regulator [Nonomuraea sp. NPDC050556]|uniref:AfsR/SARP family transcriptional regulator n=1 Tax=Nonomuraea sp. NPDC050556 TaxID=3364369 RepID=UPI0037A34881
MSLRLTLLGPVTISVDGQQVQGAAPRHRAVLAYLLLHARTVISTERLIGAMWGATPPDTARAQIHAAIAAIRQVLRASGGGQLLETTPAGYVVRPEPGQLDLEEFNRLVNEGELRSALSLWQGEALAEVNADYVDEARTRLEERRLATVERLAESELSRGRHAQLIEELQAEVAAHPLRERLSGQLMTALHRSDRQADALAVARAFRTVLAEEQGLDPSRSFLALEQSILRGETTTAKSFLPYDIPDFTGRAVELRELAEAASVWAIDGMAGIGKTTLAVHAAHLLAGSFPDGRLFVDLHGHTAGQAPVDPDTALEILLGQLGVPADRIGMAGAERTALWRSALAGRRVLVVLDNAAGTDHVRPLLPGTPGTLVLITSRQRLVDLDGTRALSMEALPAEDAVALFTAVVGERALAEPDAVLDVLRMCGFLPLAVRITAARLRHRPRWTVAYLADRLRDQPRRLNELATADRGVAAAFGLSYQQLNPAQQRMFLLLGLHPGGDFDPYAASALADLPLDRAEALLEDLLDAHMLLQHEPGRYTFHDLLREFARSDAPVDSAAALERLARHYLDVASAAVDLYHPQGAGHRPHTAATRSFRDAAEAIAWLDAERANLIAAAGPYTGQMSATLSWYLYERAHHAEAQVLHARALEQSREQGDRAAEATALTNLGVANWRKGRYAEAAAEARQALELFRELGDPAGEATALNNLGNLHLLHHEYDEALTRYQQALDLHRSTGNAEGEGWALNNLGLVHERLGDHARAAGYHRQALDLHRRMGHPEGEAWALNNLGVAEEDVPLLRQALELHREVGSRDGEVETLRNLGDAALRAGSLDEAADWYDRSLTLARELCIRLEQARAHEGLARALDDPDAGRPHLEEAARLYRELDVSPDGGARR